MRFRLILIGALGGCAVGALATAASGAMVFLDVSGTPAANYRIMLAADDASGARAIARGSDARISPDGTKVAYQVVGRGDNPATRILDVASGATAAVPGTCQVGLTWSPDSRLLACMTQSVRGEFVTGNGLSIATVPTSLAGIASIPLAVVIPSRGSAVEWGMAFSPDSTRIAYSYRAFSSRALSDLWVASVANPSARSRILTRATGPAWGAGGIAATRTRNVLVRLGPGPRTRVPRGQVWLVNPDGSAARQITHQPLRGLEFGPGVTAWVPGGGALIGQLGGEDYSQAIRVDVATGRVTKLVSTTVSSAVAVSADGDTVLVQDGLQDVQTRIRTVGIDGTGVRTLRNRAVGASVTANWNP